MRPRLIVWPDGLWLAEDVTDGTIAKGTWSRKDGRTVAYAELVQRGPRELPKAEKWCAAVVAMADAMALYEAG